MWILISWLLRSQLIWFYPVYKTGYSRAGHGKDLLKKYHVYKMLRGLSAAEVTKIMGGVTSGENVLH